MSATRRCVCSRMTRSKVKVNVAEVRRLRKWLAISSAGMHVIKSNQVKSNVFNSDLGTTKIHKMIITRIQAVARIADRTAKNCRGHVT